MRNLWSKKPGKDQGGVLGSEGNTRLICPWDSLGKNTAVGCHALLQGTFLTQGSNPLLSPTLPGGFFTTSITQEALNSSGPHWNNPNQHSPRVYRGLQQGGQEGHHSVTEAADAFLFSLPEALDFPGRRQTSFLLQFNPSWPAPFNPLRPAVRIPSSARPSLGSPSNSGAS